MTDPADPSTGEPAREPAPPASIEQRLAPSVRETCPRCGRPAEQDDLLDPVTFCWHCGVRLARPTRRPGTSGRALEDVVTVVRGELPSSASEPVSHRRVNLALVVALTVFAVLVAGSILAEPLAVLPWFHPLAALAGTLLAAGLAVAGVVLSFRRSRRRQGRVELHADRVVLWKRAGVLVVLLADLAGYDARAADAVQLRRRDELVAAPELAIPTLDEAARLGVLAWLDERQLPRLEP